ncbi:DUF317 domain-containing protein [Streptomyces sp. NPDC006798]|uniref:DUF317 domain-containing protein n=1 Tax=Streptomyces sp. NPDC006798 TaxID=3155462 RepID=UPI0033EE7717
MTDPGDAYVHPRYLAGSTTIGDPGLRPALDADWKVSHDDLGNVFLPSPDQRIRIGFLPEGDDDALWKIAAYEETFASPRWGAAFASECPPEFVTAFTTVLVETHARGGDAFLGDGLSRTGDPYPVLAPLTDADWTVTDDWWTLKVTSPDGLAGVWYRRGAIDHDGELTSNAARWQMWGGPRDLGWYAVFSTHTPAPFITATAAAIADPAPVRRWSGELTQMTRAHARITPVRPPAPTPGDIARAHWRPAPTARTRTVPRWSTSTPSGRLPAPARAAARR